MPQHAAASQNFLGTVGACRHGSGSVKLSSRQPPSATNRQPPTATNHQPPTANRRQPPNIVQYCFCGLVACPHLDHKAEGVPVNARFCWRYEGSIYLLEGSRVHQVGLEGRKEFVSAKEKQQKRTADLLFRTPGFSTESMPEDLTDSCFSCFSSFHCPRSLFHGLVQGQQAAHAVG